LKGGRVKIFGNNFNNKNSIQEEIKSRLNSGNPCNHFSAEPFAFKKKKKKYKD
jgi:hypothetical protein